MCAPSSCVSAACTRPVAGYNAQRNALALRALCVHGHAQPCTREHAQQRVRGAHMHTHAHAALHAVRQRNVCARAYARATHLQMKDRAAVCAPRAKDAEAAGRLPVEPKAPVYAIRNRGIDRRLQVSVFRESENSGVQRGGVQVCAETRPAARVLTVERETARRQPLLGWRLGFRCNAFESTGACVLVPHVGSRCHPAASERMSPHCPCLHNHRQGPHSHRRSRPHSRSQRSVG